MARMYSTDILNTLKLNLFLSNHCILDKSWHADNISSPTSRLYFIRDGNGWIRYNNKTVFLEGGKVYLIPSGMEISYGCTELEKIFFHITVCGFEKTDILTNFTDIYSLPFSKESFDSLLKTTNSNDYRDKLRLKQILYSTIVEFFDSHYIGKIPVIEYSDTVKKLLCIFKTIYQCRLHAKILQRICFFHRQKYAHYSKTRPV